MFFNLSIYQSICLYIFFTIHKTLMLQQLFGTTATIAAIICHYSNYLAVQQLLIFTATIVETITATICHYIYNYSNKLSFKKST